jgi:xylose isomerase
LRRRPDAVTSSPSDPIVSRYALARTLAAIDLGAELGAEILVTWGGREGVECEAGKDPRLAVDRYAEAVNRARKYIRAQGVRDEDSA